MSPCRKHRHHRSPRVLAVPGGGTLPRGCAPLWPRAGAVPAAWSNHGRHHRSLCREGSAGPLGAVERQTGRLRTATLGAPAPSAGASREVREGGSPQCSVGVHRDRRWRWVTVTLLCLDRGWGDEGDPPALTWPGLILPLAGAAGQPLLVVLLLLGSDPLHPARQTLLRSPLPQIPRGHPHPRHPHRGAPRCWWLQGKGPRCPPKPTHCRFSWASDFFSACRWERMLFRMLALNSATPLQGQREGEGGTRTPAPTGTLRDPSPTLRLAGQRPGGPA